MPILYLLILFIPVLIYVTLSALVLFHLKKYGIAGDFTRQIIILFFIVSVFLLFMTTWSFFSVPWDDLNLTELIQAIQGSNPVFYQR
jgi:predicted membrane channel-forming protein YqfA (hemolysin III family)